ncbi:(Lipo)protein [Seminavis robusta]|uniref:(Lipo)protein n=1 Tax=Seminavis robusta TaxID=568900 RepID=A0A9N8DYL4_9STRA|nr:(Lipo)protein [Seminavis robusta]|eukprot:Sro472_g149990.1 (Lipo)protein (250) ;mRNA; f:49996-51466
MPSTRPSKIPSKLPSASPSSVPSISPSDAPSSFPSITPSAEPSGSPSGIPSSVPSMAPTYESFDSAEELRNALFGTLGCCVECACDPDYNQAHDSESLVSQRYGHPAHTWDISKITDLSYVFAGYQGTVDLDLNGWDTSNVVESLLGAFSECEFSGDISEWDVSSVTDMSYMLWETTCCFASALNEWNVAKVTNFEEMFGFEVTIPGGIGKWDVTGNGAEGGVYTMFMFATAVNVPDLTNDGGWDTSNI